MTETFAGGGLTLTPGPVARLTLTAPATRNAMTRAMWQALPQVLSRIAGDRSVRVVVLTGAGGAFSAGADIGEFAEVYASAESALAYNRLVRAGVQALRDLPRPVLARIEGACVGGGVALALAADLRLADPAAAFAIPPARLGIAYSPEDTAMLVAAIGAAAAKDLIFTARRIDAAEALRIGLIDRLSAPGGLDDMVADMAETIAALSPAAITQAKATVNALTPSAAAPDLRAGFDALFSGPDFAEGRAAFLDRRPPRF